MNIQCKLFILIFVLTLDDRVHAGKIIGGHEAVPHSRPYMALLEMILSDGQGQHCGGFLLNEDFVMTAAHCKAKSYTVKLGVHNITNMEGVQRLYVEKTFPLNSYNKTAHTDDIMLLKLSSKATFTETVRPISLAGNDDASLPKSCSVAGWGITDNRNVSSDVLMEVNVTLLDNKKCAEEKLYCTEGDVGFDKGDSGGPLVCEGEKAFGVVAFHIKHSRWAFAKIPGYKPWIVSAMKNSEMP